jgi:hypothetical protein
MRSLAKSFRLKKDRISNSIDKPWHTSPSSLRFTVTECLPNEWFGSDRPVVTAWRMRQLRTSFVGAKRRKDVKSLPNIK